MECTWCGGVYDYGDVCAGGDLKCMSADLWSKIWSMNRSMILMQICSMTLVESCAGDVICQKKFFTVSV